MLRSVINHLLTNRRSAIGQHRVILVGIDHHIVLFARLVERTTYLNGILEMDIVVGSAVYDKQARTRR